MYPPGLDDPNPMTELPSATAIVTAGHPGTTTLSPRRRISGRRCTPSQTSTTAPLPLEDSSNRSLDLNMDTVSERTDETGPVEHKRPRTSEGGMLRPLEPEAFPGASEEIAGAAVENCQSQHHPEPQPERGRSRSPERYHAGLLVGRWYSLVLDHSGVLVSEAVNNEDLEQERAYIPRLHATLTGPTDGPDDGSDCTTVVNALSARSSDEDLPSGSLIQLVASVYGLSGAPLRWHRTLTAWLVKQGYRKFVLEPCLYVHYAPDGSVDGLILIDVDDLAMGTEVPSSVSLRKVGETGGQLRRQTDLAVRPARPCRSGNIHFGKASPSALAREKTFVLLVVQYCPACEHCWSSCCDVWHRSG